jgi:diacylglycerol kinase family enzyme
VRLLIVNPYASSVTPGLLRRVEQALAPVETALTERKGHAIELAAEAGGAEAVYVFGGDGTFNEVLNGVPAHVPVGFVPGGGTSVLPRALGFPRDAVRTARMLAHARERPISLGRVNGRRFAFSAGIGFDAELVRRVEALGRAPSGKRAGDVRFALTTLRLLAERRVRFEPELEIDGLGRAAFALVANCDPYSYAGALPLRMAPEARFEDGLDVVAPARLRARMLPRLVTSVLLTHAHVRAPWVRYAHDRDRIEIRCDRPLPLQVDGEDIGDVVDAVFEAEREAAIVLAPRAS